MSALLVAAVPPAAAQCQLCAPDTAASAVAARQAATPLRVDVETRLDMGRIAVGAMGGEVEIDPASGARRLRGDVVDLGGFALTGTVTVRGEPGAEVRVILPASVDLESGHGRTARVTGLATDLSADLLLIVDRHRDPPAIIAVVEARDLEPAAEAEDEAAV